MFVPLIVLIHSENEIHNQGAARHQLKVLINNKQLKINLKKSL